MSHPVLIGADPVPAILGGPGLQEWLQEQYPINTGADERARQVRAENIRRVQLALSRNTRAIRAV